GKQQSWPRSPSSLTKTDFTIPVYMGLPSKPYEVIGFVVNSEPLLSGNGLSEWLWSDETRLGNACNQAKAHGADAILLTKDQTILEALKSQAAALPESSRLLVNYDGQVAAIRWTDHH